MTRKRRSTYFKGYHYRRYAAVLWLTDALWIAAFTAVIIMSVGDITRLVTGLALLLAGSAILITLALHFGNLARLEFAKVTPLLGVVRPLDRSREQ